MGICALADFWYNSHCFEETSLMSVEIERVYCRGGNFDCAVPINKCHLSRILKSNIKI